ncbi:tetratricopeptide repeat protein [bacterium]|nr:tetratricopeptide repeat protein [bacterium]
MFRAIIFSLVVLFTVTGCGKKDANKGGTDTKKVEKVEVKADPILANAEYKEAMEMVKAWKTKEALPKLEGLKAKFPNSAELHFQLGSLYKKSMKDDDAIKAFEEAIKLNPKHIEAMRELAKVYYYKKKDAESRDMWKKIAELDPNDKLALYEQGHKEYILKDYDNAIVTLEKAVKVNPKHVWSYYYISDSYNYGKKDKEKALKALERGLEANPNDKTLMQKMASTHSWGQDYKSAIDWYLKILELNKTDAYTMEQIAANYGYLKDFDKQIEWLKKALEVKPKDTFFLSNLANAYAEKKDYDTSIATYKTLLEVKDDYYYKYQLGRVYVKAGKKDGVKEMVEALKKDTNKSAATYVGYLEGDLAKMK